MGTSRAMAFANLSSELAFIAIKILRFTTKFSSFVCLNISSAEECQLEFLRSFAYGSAAQPTLRLLL